MFTPNRVSSIRQVVKTVEDTMSSRQTNPLIMTKTRFQEMQTCKHVMARKCKNIFNARWHSQGIQPKNTIWVINARKMKAHILQNHAAKTSTKRHHVQMEGALQLQNDLSKAPSKRHSAGDKWTEIMQTHCKIIRPVHLAANTVWETRNDSTHTSENDPTHGVQEIFKLQPWKVVLPELGR